MLIMSLWLGLHIDADPWIPCILLYHALYHALSRIYPNAYPNASATPVESRGTQGLVTPPGTALRPSLCSVGALRPALRDSRVTQPPARPRCPRAQPRRHSGSARARINKGRARPVLGGKPTRSSYPDLPPNPHPVTLPALVQLQYP